MNPKKIGFWICALLAVAVPITLAIGGNPANMAICVACFLRDTAGALRLHEAAIVQYVRPEIVGIIAGACILAFATKEFKPTAGSSPITRFFLGIIIMIGCLIFLGCPLRMVLRMAGGDLNAWVALIGFVGGILVGILFLKKGFSLGRAYDTKKAEGLMMPIAFVVLLILSVTTTAFAASVEGPGSVHAPLALSLICGLVLGAIAQRTRLCFAGGIRDVFLVKDFAGLIMPACIFVGMLIYNIISGNFNVGFENQPIAHSESLWNILGMFVVGLGCTLAGGCPLRQLILTGNGSSDSAITVIGLIVGAAICHNFGFASSAAGTTVNGQIACIVCIGLLVIIGLVNIRKNRLV
ncbi:MAG: YedE family putative selenium transporter [Raoultibacter sp.]